MTARLNKAVLFFQILSIIFGGLIYCAFRTKDLLLFYWARTFGLDATVDLLREISYHIKPRTPNWLLFSVPDGLWVLSYTCLILYIWDFKLNRKNIFWFALVPSLALGSEILQSMRIIPGTFDFIDIAAYIIGLLVPLIIFNIDFKIKNEQ